MVHSLLSADVSTVSLWHGLAEVFGGTTKRIAEVHVPANPYFPSTRGRILGP